MDSCSFCSFLPLAAATGSCRSTDAPFRGTRAVHQGGPNGLLLTRRRRACVPQEMEDRIALSIQLIIKPMLSSLLEREKKRLASAGHGPPTDRSDTGSILPADSAVARVVRSERLLEIINCLASLADPGPFGFDPLQWLREMNSVREDAQRKAEAGGAATEGPSLSAEQYTESKTRSAVTLELIAEQVHIELLQLILLVIQHSPMVNLLSCRKEVGLWQACFVVPLGNGI